MNHYYTFHKRRVTVYMTAVAVGCVLLMGRLGYMMIGQSNLYETKANDLHERQREIKAPRGCILDRNGVELASNKSVCTISVIHNQIEDAEQVIKVLAKALDMDEERVRTLVEKRSSREKMKSNVDKTIAEEIRNQKLKGVMVDEDYKRYYPFDELASKVIGFTGGDNQGIVGLEVKYDSVLAGTPGYILTTTDVHGIRVKNTSERRQEAIAGNDLLTSIDYNIQTYGQQIAQRTMEEKQAKRVSLIVWNPQNGEIYACVNVPEYHLQDPFTLNTDINTKCLNPEKKQDLINQMWRNPTVSDTYEPGSTFKIITATAALEKGVVKVSDTFHCPGFKIVDDRRIRCHKYGGHGAETFREGVMNSCNPVFMEVGARVGAKDMYHTYQQLGLFEPTGIDLPGEANSIMHPLKQVGPVELATMSFGQSFQITPFQLLRAASAVVNGGRLVTPHFAVAIRDGQTGKIKKLSYKEEHNRVSATTSEIMRSLLHDVVSEGSGKNAKLSGYSIGGKTATSEKLPRGTGKYISSFLGFAPAEHPEVMALLMIEEPTGTYYGGVIAAPVVGELFSSILPYMGIEQTEPANQSVTDVMNITD